MAESAPSYQVTREGDQYQVDNKVGDQTIKVTDGETVGGHVEKIDFDVTTGTPGKIGDGPDPRNPDQPFDPVASGNAFVMDGKKGFLVSGTGTDPATETSTQKERAEKQQGKHDPTAVDDPFAGGTQDHGGRKVVKDGRKQEKREQNQPLSNPLPSFDIHSPPQMRYSDYMLQLPQYTDFPACGNPVVYARIE